MNNNANLKHGFTNDERNLAYKAASLLQEKSGRLGKLTIELKKRIPVSAGLAGGSGNAAAVLIGLNRIWNLKYNTKELCELANTLGTDVPFLVLVQNSHYCLALGKGTGDQLEPIKKSFKKDYTQMVLKRGIEPPTY